MENFAYYLFKSVIWLSGFTIIFILFLRNERFFLLNRLYLISGILVSFILPLISVHYTIEIPGFQNLQANAVSGNPLKGSEASDMNITYVLTTIYITGTLSILFLLLNQSRSLFRVIMNADIDKNQEAKLIKNSVYTSPFSFFSFVFISPHVSEREKDEIVNHELVHIRQFHWLDLILGHMLCMLQWFNPFVWIYMRLMKQNHEYLADEEALLVSSNPGNYKATLLNQIIGAPVVSLTNSFNYSINKKRFTMMKNIISSPYRKMKVLFILPVAAIILYSFAEPEYKYAPANEPVTLKASDELLIQDVKGVVVRQNGKPLDGAIVIIKGTTTGTITDGKGNFKLTNVPDEGMLVVSYIGFKTKIIKPDFASEMKIQLVGDTINIKSKEVPPPPPPSDMPPPPPPPPPLTFRSSTDGPPPLMVLDGIIVSQEKANLVNPETIESVSVLKDESAKLKYGEKGKNGVIEITTKNSKPLLAEAQGKPLIVLDDVIMGNKEISDLNINPNDIQSVNVIKGQSGIDKYGEEARDGVIEITKKEKVTGYADQGKEPFVVVEEMPAFPGGEKALQSWIKANTGPVPTDALRNVKEPVKVAFTVDKSGKVTKVKVLKAVQPALDAEAVRIVSNMPDWKPGSQSGKKVNVQVVIPIDFRSK